MNKLESIEVTKCLLSGFICTATNQFVAGITITSFITLITSFNSAFCTLVNCARYFLPSKMLDIFSFTLIANDRLAGVTNRQRKKKKKKKHFSE